MTTLSRAVEPSMSSRAPSRDPMTSVVDRFTAPGQEKGSFAGYNNMSLWALVLCADAHLSTTTLLDVFDSFFEFLL